MGIGLFLQRNKTLLWIPEKRSFTCYSLKCICRKSSVSWSSNNEKSDYQVNPWNPSRWLHLAWYNFILSVIFELSQMSSSMVNYILHLFCRNTWDQDWNAIEHTPICLNQGVHLMRSLFFCTSLCQMELSMSWGFFSGGDANFKQLGNN